MDKKKIKALIIVGVLVTVIITITFSIPFIKFIKDPIKLRNLLESYGLFAPLMYILLTMIQVLIPFIPGEPFELLGGYMFGTIKGTILCLLSGSIASILIIVLVKKYGTKLIEIFFDPKEHQKTKHLQSKKAFIIYALLFIIPGTPKDLLCYIGGLSNFDIIPLIIVTTIGRLPGIVTSTVTGGSIGDKKYILAIIVYGITIIISAIGLYVYKRNVEKRF